MRRNQKVSYREHRHIEESRNAQASALLIPGRTPPTGVALNAQPRNWLDFDSVKDNRSFEGNRILGRGRIIDFTQNHKSFNLPRMPEGWQEPEEMRDQRRSVNKTNLKKQGKASALIKVETLSNRNRDNISGIYGKDGNKHLPIEL